jgi:diguanylate cyclase (GGDEF)-like protein/PAS domain S-box-containing protein
VKQALKQNTALQFKVACAISVVAAVTGTFDERICGILGYHHALPLLLAANLLSGAAPAILIAVSATSRIRSLLASEKETRREATQAIHLLSAVLESLPDGVFFKDVDGRFTRINGAYAKRLELDDPTEARGKSYSDYFDKGWAATARAEEIEVQQTRKPVLNREHLEPSETLGDAWVSTSRLPLLDVDGNLVGTLGISRDLTGRKYTEQALESANAQLTSWVTELEVIGKQTVLLAEMAEILQTCLSEEEAQGVINQYAHRLFTEGAGMVAVMKASRNFAEATSSWGENSASEFIFPPDQCWALRRGRVQHGSGSSSPTRCAHVHKDFSGNYLCVPMMAQGEGLGVLHLSVPAGVRDFTEEQQRLAATFAERVGLALANLKLREVLRSQSIRDPLTGLFNRRYMEESLEREIRRAARNGKSVGAIMVDLDHFKRFNDTFGHDAGDMLLREFGLLARGKTRKEDIACRYGGEEFILILPDAPLAVTIARAEELREAVKHLELKSHGQAIGVVTTSIGVSSFPEHALTPEALVRVADTALYKAKHGGRDRVVVAPAMEVDSVEGAHCEVAAISRGWPILTQLSEVAAVPLNGMLSSAPELS